MSVSTQQNKIFPCCFPTYLIASQILKNILYIAAQLIKTIENANLDALMKPKMMKEVLDRDNEKDPIHFIAILIECLARLDKLPESIEVVYNNDKKFVNLL